MANDNIGEIACAHHNGPRVQAFVRLDKKSKLYIFCPSCGIIAPRNPSFQEFIKENASMYGTPSAEYSGGGEPEEKTQPENKIQGQEKTQTAETKPEVKPSVKTKKSSLLTGFMNALGSEE